MRRGLVVILALIAIPVLGLAACNGVLSQREKSHAETVRTLHEEARALVPASARVVAEEESACVGFRSFPSCVTITLDWSGSDEARFEALEALARSRGWGSAPNRPSFVFVRDGLQAGIYIRRRLNGWEELCAGKDPFELDAHDRDRCLDQVSVRVN